LIGLLAAASCVTITRMVRVVALVLALTGVAAAQTPEPDATQGAKLFEEGRELAKAGRYAEACAKFEQSYTLDNGVGTELNLADCHEHLGHAAQAWRLFDEAAQRSTDNATRQKFARSRADALTGKLATAVVNLEDPDQAGLSVTIAGRAVKTRGVITERVDPGAIAVHIATPGKTLFDATRTADAGATVIFDVPAPAPVAVADQAPRAVRRHSRLVLAYAISGAGLATLAAGIVVGVRAKSSYDDAIDPARGCMTVGGTLQCPDPQRARALDAGRLADIGTAVGVVGLAAIVGGVVLYATAPKDLVVAPVASNQTAGLAISGRF
jgi:tetratricopeptide (TPR) repeat protein